MVQEGHASNMKTIFAQKVLVLGAKVTNVAAAGSSGVQPCRPTIFLCFLLHLVITPTKMYAISTFRLILEVYKRQIS